MDISDFKEINQCGVIIIAVLKLLFVLIIVLI
jgi:hypothetical protein